VTVNDNQLAMNSQTTNQLNSIADRSRRSEGFVYQAPRREAEDSARRHAAAVCDELTGRGYRYYQVTGWLHLPSRTLCRWRHLRRQPPAPLPRGRPCKQSPPSNRRAVLQWLVLKGPHMGLPSLRHEFPAIPRCELADLQADYRRYFRATHRLSREELTWHVPGTVWAMDHSHPLGPIDGIRAEILAIRDLGSGMQLAWEAVPDETAATTAAVLESFIRQHGPPLVIKSDNGSAFKSEELMSLLARHRIVWLPSPPRMPWYNGGCEAGNGTMKVRTNTLAYLAGELGCWTTACMEAARREANRSRCLPDRVGLTHADRWTNRPVASDQQRDQLETLIRTHQRAIIDEMPEFNPRNRNLKHKVLRQAVRRALLDAGLLTITRRSITPPLNRQNWAKIS